MATYVLVHGAYQGGWIWKPVAQHLQKAGHSVYAPTLEGCGERHARVRAGITVTTHAREIERLLFFEDLSDIVLVGTLSCGQREGGGGGETVWLACACSASTETRVTVTPADGLRKCLPEEELNRLAVELREVVELDHVNPALA